MRSFFAALTLVLFASCIQAPAVPMDPLDISGPVYRLNVAKVDITHDFISLHRPPNVEYLADVKPFDAVRRWADARLIPAGNVNSLEVDIKDASIVRKDLPRQKDGIEGAFTTEQTEQYDGTLDVELKIYSPDRVLSVAHLEVTAHRMLTLADNAAPVDRQHLYHEMTVALMTALKPQLDDGIRRYFGNYLM